MNPRNLSLADLVQTLFIGLKLTGYIDWSWWLVLSPFIIGVIIATAITMASASIDKGK